MTGFPLVGWGSLLVITMDKSGNQEVKNVHRFPKTEDYLEAG